jgi:hypothetical protein
MRYRFARRTFLALMLIAATCGRSQHAHGQVRPEAAPAVPPGDAIKDYEFTCPGSFPSDLTIVDCDYPSRTRFQQFLTTGFTDQAMLLSATGSLFTLALKTPGEWPRTWKYYGYRVGASYTQSAGNATAQYIVGAIFHDDPRHVQCNRDPLLYGNSPSGNTPFLCSTMRRVGHALLDSVTVRHSFPGVVPPQSGGTAKKDQDTRQQIRSKYRRFPAFSRLVGVFAGAYAQYPWEPGANNKIGAISQRAALAFAPTFLGSFYTEFSSSLFSAMKKPRQ